MPSQHQIMDAKKKRKTAQDGLVKLDSAVTLLKMTKSESISSWEIERQVSKLNMAEETFEVNHQLIVSSIDESDSGLLQEAEDEDAQFREQTKVVRTELESIEEVTISYKEYRNLECHLRSWLSKFEDEWKSMVTLLSTLKVKFDQFSSTVSADGTYNHIELQQEFDNIQEKMQQMEMALT